MNCWLGTDCTLCNSKKSPICTLSPPSCWPRSSGGYITENLRISTVIDSHQMLAMNSGPWNCARFFFTIKLVILRPGTFPEQILSPTHSSIHTWGNLDNQPTDCFQNLWCETGVPIKPPHRHERTVIYFGKHFIRSNTKQSRWIFH